MRVVLVVTAVDETAGSGLGQIEGGGTTEATICGYPKTGHGRGTVNKEPRNDNKERKNHFPVAKFVKGHPGGSRTW